MYPDVTQIQPAQLTFIWLLSSKDALIQPFIAPECAKTLYVYNKPRGALPLRQFCFLRGEVRILEEKEFNAPQAMDLREKINPS